MSSDRESMGRLVTLLEFMRLPAALDMEDLGMEAGLALRARGGAWVSGTRGGQATRGLTMRDWLLLRTDGRREAGGGWARDASVVWERAETGRRVEGYVIPLVEACEMMWMVSAGRWVMALGEVVMEMSTWADVSAELRALAIGCVTLVGDVVWGRRRVGGLGGAGEAFLLLLGEVVMGDAHRDARSGRAMGWDAGVDGMCGMVNGERALLGVLRAFLEEAFHLMGATVGAPGVIPAGVLGSSAREESVADVLGRLVSREGAEALLVRYGWGREWKAPEARAELNRLVTWSPAGLSARCAGGALLRGFRLGPRVRELLAAGWETSEAEEKRRGVRMMDVRDLPLDEASPWQGVVAGRRGKGAGRRR